MGILFEILLVVLRARLRSQSIALSRAHGRLAGCIDNQPAYEVFSERLN